MPMRPSGDREFELHESSPRNFSRYSEPRNECNYGDYHMPRRPFGDCEFGRHERSPRNFRHFLEPERYPTQYVTRGDNVPESSHLYSTEKDAGLTSLFSSRWWQT
jgi:hypothetical protein